MKMINSSGQRASKVLPRLGYVFVVICICTTISSLVYAQKHTHKEEDAIANAFISSIKSRNYEDLKKHFPTVEVFRTTAPDETQGKSDAEVLEIAKPLSDGLDSGFHSLLREADRLNVNVKKINFKSQRISAIPMTNGAFYLQEIYFTYNKKKGLFTIGLALIDKWYIYAIEKTEGVFTEMK